MKSKLLSIIYMFVFFCANAQREADILYTGLNYFSVPNEPPTSTTILKFNADRLEEINNSCTIATSNFYSGATYSDKYGNWKFTINGWRVVNSYGEALSYRLWSDSIPWPNNQPDTALVDYSKGPLFLTNPNDSDQVYLFCSHAKRNIFPRENNNFAISPDGSVEIINVDILGKLNKDDELKSDFSFNTSNI